MSRKIKLPPMTQIQMEISDLGTVDIAIIKDYCTALLRQRVPKTAKKPVGRKPKPAVGDQPLPVVPINSSVFNPMLSQQGGPVAISN